MSPKNFESCVARNGRVGTKKLKGGKYIHICFVDGSSHTSEVHEKKRKR